MIGYRLGSEGFKSPKRTEPGLGRDRPCRGLSSRWLRSRVTSSLIRFRYFDSERTTRLPCATNKSLTNVCGLPDTMISNVASKAYVGRIESKCNIDG